MASVSGDSAEYIGWRLEVFIGVFTPLVIAAVALRFYARSLTASKRDAGDWLILAALVGQIVAGGIAIGSVKQAGVGHHVEYLAETNPEAITTFFKYLVAMSTWYASTESLAKLAVCLLYKRVFPQKPVIITINITMFILIGASIGGGLADLFGCTPFSAHWGSAEEQAKYCINTEALFVWGSFPNIVTDVIMLTLPMPIVWKLHTSKMLRLALVTTFLFGNIGLITSILRFVAFYNKSSFIDPTYSGVELIIWTVCEPGVYLIAACLVVYRPLLEKVGIIPSRTSVVNSDQTPWAMRGHSYAPDSGKRASKSVGSRTIAGSGDGSFVQLEDSDERPLRNSRIRATTDIEMAWGPRAQ
ncbi:hypothetical protein G7054_g5470 [Neopestalotiopsis clavispora]|nr:hypothetical protein E8E14_002260 [Neopestalotiopsis sp. 37M]KAF7535329.1 hypothetical protein G7054_g5470 [Neopestalotiopsis clavispora]